MFAQVLSSILISGAYLVLQMYICYSVKKNFDSWKHDLNEVRIWLIIESVGFFNSIVSGFLFLNICYIFKIKSYNGDELIRFLKLDPWNSKDTLDFFSYLKNEFFIVNFIIDHGLKALILGYVSKF